MNHDVSYLMIYGFSGRLRRVSVCGTWYDEPVKNPFQSNFRLGAYTDTRPQTKTEVRGRDRPPPHATIASPSHLSSRSLHTDRARRIRGTAWETTHPTRTDHRVSPLPPVKSIMIFHCQLTLVAQ